MKKTYEKGEYSRLFADQLAARLREFKLPTLTLEQKELLALEVFSNADLEEIARKCSLQRKNSRVKTESDLFELL